MALKTNHLAVIVAVMGIMALTLIGAGVLSGKQGPGYVRINVSDKTAVCLEFNGAELRAAASAEGLKTAEPIPLRATNYQPPHSEEFTLPIPADQLPEGISAVKGSFMRFGNIIQGQLGICRTDAQKAVWQCDVEIGTKLGDRAGTAQPIVLPSLEKLTLAVTGAPANGKLGVGVQLLSGNDRVSGVRKDGKPVPAQVSVTDAKGNEVGGKKGPLADFGFS